MTNEKKDLTRIEDLGEYLHALEEEEELPTLPEDEDATSHFNFPLEEDPFTSPGETADESADEATVIRQNFELPDEPETVPESNTEIDFSESPSPGEDNEDEAPSDHFAQASDLLKAEVESYQEDFSSPTKSSTIGYKDSEANDYDLLTIDRGMNGTDHAPSESQDRPDNLLSSFHEVPPSTFTTPENFSDLKKFAESTSFSGMSAEGNPSFSVLIREVRYVEDVSDIIILLKELKLLSDPEEQVRARLMRGNLLIPRVSEYAAIFLAHKMRRFDIDIQVGLSDEIHPPRHQEAPETGMVSKHNLFQNQTHHFHFDDPKLELSQIIVAATPGLEGYQVIRYMGVASEHKMIDSQIVEDESSSEIPGYYHELAQKLKAHALKANSNAVVGVNYQLTPLPAEYGISGHRYRLTCTGNMVWVNKL